VAVLKERRKVGGVGSNHREKVQRCYISRLLEERLKERGLEKIVRVKSLSFMDERMKFSNCIYMARVLPSKVATAKNWHALSTASDSTTNLFPDLDVNREDQ
jgi:hypothetical protein